MAERYGYYKGTQIPRGQLRQFIKLQQRPSSKLPASARDLALRALQGAIPNLIGTASEFDDTATYYKDDNGERPTRQQWLDYTKDFAAKKQYLWPSHSQPYDPVQAQRHLHSWQGKEPRGGSQDRPAGLRL